MKWKRTRITDLPMRIPHRDTAAVHSTIIKTFVHERMDCKNCHQLRNFVKKWRAMWLLSPGSKMKDAPKNSIIQRARHPLGLEERALLTGSYDGKYVLRCLMSKDGVGIDFKSKNARIAGHIAMPRPSLHAFELAEAYGVGSDLGFIRLYADTYPALDDVGREGGWGRVPRWENEVDADD